MAATKVAIRRQHSGSFGGDQAQLQAQRAAAKTNAHVDAISVLNNRTYIALATDNTIAASVGVYTVLLTVNINTLLANGFLIITFSASGVHLTAQGTTLFKIFLDGVSVKGCYSTVGAGFAWSQNIMVRVPVKKGAHAVQLQWSTDVNSARINANTNANEHADLLVQEAA